MNLFLGSFRRLALGGVVLLALSLAIKGGLPDVPWNWILLASPLAYLLFMFFTWLSAKSSTKVISDQVGVDIPTKSFFATLARGLFIDITSPIGSVVRLFGNISTRFASCIITYVIIAACVCIWFFVL